MNKGVEFYIEKAKQRAGVQMKHRNQIRTKKFDTIAVHGIYSLEEALTGGQGGVIEPIFSSTSQAFKDSDEMEAGLSYQIPKWVYSRIHNPTIFYLEETLALLETYGCEAEASCLCTSSGMSAVKQAIEPLVAKQTRETEEINFVSSSKVYGGTFQLFNVRMPERGVEPRWIKDPENIEEWKSQINDNTRFLYAEMPSNPQQSCIDIKEIANLAHEHNIPLVIDSTIATPALMRPIEHGADIVIHSITKTVGSSGNSIGGAIIARHNLTNKFLKDEQKTNYVVWLKLWPFRDSGPCMSPHSAFLFLSELKTLRIKMEHFCRNTNKVVNFLDNHPKVEEVFYLGLENHKLNQTAKKYMKLADSDENMFGHLCAFNIKGSVQDTRTFFDNLSLTLRATDLGRIKSIATIPAISTHMQQGEKGRELANIPPNMVRLSVGGENAKDIIDDLEQALDSF